MLKISKLFFIALLGLAGCTNNNQNTTNSEPTSQTIVTQGNGDYGVVAFNETKVKSFTFKNDSAVVINTTPQIIGSGFDLVSLGCATVEPNRSCLVKVLFSANKESGVYEAQLKVDSAVLSLRAEIESVPSVSYQFFINGLESESADLGMLSGLNLKMFTVKIKNNSPKSGSTSTITSSSNKFSILNSTCNNALKPGQSCYAKVVVKGDNTGADLLTNLSFDNKILEINIPQEIVNLDSNLQPLNSSITLGDVYKEGENRIQLLTVENLGKSAGNISDITVPPGFKVLTNNCLNVKPGAKCFIKVSYHTSNIPTGQYENQIDLGDDASVTVTVNQVTNPNKLDKVMLSVSDDVLVGTCTPVTITLKDVDNLDFVTSQAGQLVANETLYQDNSCSVSDNSLAAFEPSKTFYLKKSVAGIINLQVSYGGKSGQKNINWYNELTVSAAPIIVTNQSTDILVAGGKPPYQYSVVMGTGNISQLGSYQSTTDGDMVIRVEDSLSLSATVAIKVVKPLQLVSQKSTQVVSSAQSFSVTGGLAPFSYSVTGGGSINSTTGAYTAPSTASSVVVKVVDASNQSSQLTITVVPVLTINPLTDKIVTNQNKTFSGNGGVLPYSFSVSGVGSINSGSGLFSSGAATGNSTVKITDAIGQEATASVIVVAPLTLSAAKLNQVVNSQQTVTAGGGLIPYNYTVVSGSGSVNSVSGLFTAGANAGPVGLKVTDNSGQSAEISITLVSVLTISPTTASVIVGGTSSFVGVGGLQPYSYSLVSGGGTINATNGSFTAPNTAGSVTVRATDALNQTADSVVTVAANLAVTPGTCSFNVPESVACTVATSGGIGTKTYSVDKGTINSSGEFKGQCVNNVGSSVVTVTDQYSNSAQVTLTYPCVYNSCNQIKADMSGVTSGNFWVDPDGLNNGSNPVNVYCDHSGDGGGWTLVIRGSTVTPLSLTSSALGTVSSPTQTTTAKFSDTTIESLRAGGLYRFTCASYKRFSAPQVYNSSVARTSAEMRSFADVNLSSSPSPSSLQPNGNNIKFGDRANSGTGGWYLNLDGEWQCNNGSANSEGGLGRQNLEIYVRNPYFKYPKSCLDAKNKGALNQSGTAGSGTYLIDPDGFNNGLDPFTVSCDQVTDGGGWTVLINTAATTSATATRDYLAKFGSTSNINSTIYQDSNGFGWGTNDQFYKAFLISNLKDFNTMKITVTGYYNSPSGGLGTMSIGSASYQGLYWNQTLPGTTHFSLGDGNSSPLQQGLSYTEASGGYSENVYDVVNRTFNLSGAYNLISWINLTGYNNTYQYTKRYFSLMMVR